MSPNTGGLVIELNPWRPDEVRSMSEPSGGVSQPGPCTLLLVDDEPYILLTLKYLLSGDYHVLTADSADAAEALFAQQPIHLVLTDQNMPQRTGLQLLEWVRANHPAT